MSQRATSSIVITSIYDGAGPITWSRDPRAFGVQDPAGALHPGTSAPDGTAVFNLTFKLKSKGLEASVLTGTFAHGRQTAGSSI
jgi:hypothetical protein